MGNLKKTKSMVLFSVFASIIFIQTLVPFLGFIPLGVMNATIIHITVAIGAIILGFKYGAGLGFVFGLASMYKNTILPNPTSFCFSPFIPMLDGNSGGIRSLIVCFVPRILVGVVAYCVYKYFKKKNKINIGLILAGFFSSITNTVFVMGFIYLLFGSDYAASTNRSIESLSKFIMGIIAMQGVPEAIISSLITLGVIKSLLKAKDIMQ